MLDCLNNVCAITHSSGLVQTMQDCLNNVCAITHSSGLVQTMLDCLNNVCAITHSSGLVHAMLDCLNNMSMCYNTQQQSQKHCLYEMGITFHELTWFVND